MKKILIVGANSAIAQACARRWVQRGDAVFLAARGADALKAQVQDLTVRGAKLIGSRVFDANQLEDHAALMQAATEALGGLDGILIAHGTLTDQARAQSDVAYALSEIATNGTTVISLMSLAAQQFEKQGRGGIAVISSVAGDRGRQSNYVYGSAKALVSAFASGLRQRMHKCGVSVTTIKPGFVDTPMTAAFKKGALWAQPDQVAKDIVKAMDQGKAV
ncbi:MAG TPA: SDR family oxidoreductase, partial [Aquabacterium sp.]|nr:SDR family oxidoreductase [Aquabacterium sp.]